MVKELLEKKEKKVEYIELIYDLIFVYIIGRNNSLLHHFEGGFVEAKAFFAYILCTLAVIQIWNFSTFYINMFGKNRAREYIFLFINMYLLYFIGQGTTIHWQRFQSQYHIAWGLILINIAIQYIFELKNQRENAVNIKTIKKILFALLFESALVFIAAIPNVVLGIVFSALAIISGIVLTSLSRKKDNEVSQIDFSHLTERAMLYVVFTFGEMIIAISSYFTGNGKFNISVIYFSLMAFLIVAALFLSYGFVYDNLIDRENTKNSMLYMMIHIFIIFALNNITASLEFMREEKIDLIPKMIFLVASLVLYYLFLFSLQGYAKCSCKPSKKLIISNLALAFLFIILMIILRENMHINIFISVLFVFSVFLVLYLSYRKLKKL